MTTNRNSFFFSEVPNRKFLSRKFRNCSKPLENSNQTVGSSEKILPFYDLKKDFFKRKLNSLKQQLSTTHYIQVSAVSKTGCWQPVRSSPSDGFSESNYTCTFQGRKHGRGEQVQPRVVDLTPVHFLKLAWHFETLLNSKHLQTCRYCWTRKLPSADMHAKQAAFSCEHPRHALLVGNSAFLLPPDTLAHPACV